MSEPIVLGIESTCDETAAAIVQGRTLRSNVVASSMEEHARYGGVIPEIASRAHAEAFVPCVSQALSDATWDAVRRRRHSRIRGTRPRRMSRRGRFRREIVGMGGEQAVLRHQPRHRAYRRHAAAVRTVPQGYACVDRVRRTHVAAACRDVARHIDVVGTTFDDAAGECFDKVARLLGFPYPGGPHIDRHAQLGNPMPSKCLRALLRARPGRQHPYDFSFSGVKTAVARWIEEQQAAGHDVPIDDVCASLADSVATVLARKAMRGCEQYDSKTLIVGGGFSANSQLRAKLLEYGGAGPESRYVSLGSSCAPIMARWSPCSA